MQVTFEQCAGADVHKDTVVVCVLGGRPGAAVQKEVRTFGTTTAQLVALSDWLVWPRG